MVRADCQFDWVLEKSFYYAPGPDHFSIAEESDSKEKLLKKGSEPYIIRDENCAQEFICLVENGCLNFFRQQRIIQILADLHREVHAPRSSLKHLAEDLSRCITVLGNNIGKWLEDQGFGWQVNQDDFRDNFGFGGPWGANRYVLGIARTAAFKSFVEAFAQRFSVTKPIHGDLCGSWRTLISEPVDHAVSKWYPCKYGGIAQAEVTKIPRQKIWRVEFKDLAPLGNWYSLQGAAHEAAAKIISYGFEARAVAVGDLFD